MIRSRAHRSTQRAQQNEGNAKTDKTRIEAALLPENQESAGLSQAPGTEQKGQMETAVDVMAKILRNK